MTALKSTPINIQRSDIIEETRATVATISSKFITILKDIYRKFITIIKIILLCAFTTSILPFKLGLTTSNIIKEQLSDSDILQKRVVEVCTNIELKRMEALKKNKDHSLSLEDITLERFARITDTRRDFYLSTGKKTALYCILGVSTIIGVACLPIYAVKNMRACITHLALVVTNQDTKIGMFNSFKEWNYYSWDKPVRQALLEDLNFYIFRNGYNSSIDIIKDFLIAILCLPFYPIPSMSDPNAADLLNLQSLSSGNNAAQIARLNMDWEIF